MKGNGSHNILSSHARKNRQTEIEGVCHRPWYINKAAVFTSETASSEPSRTNTSQHHSMLSTNNNTGQCENAPFTVPNLTYQVRICRHTDRTQLRVDLHVPIFHQSSSSSTATTTKFLYEWNVFEWNECEDGCDRQIGTLKCTFHICNKHPSCVRTYGGVNYNS